MNYHSKVIFLWREHDDFLFSSTAKGSGTTLCTKFQNKISNNYRCDDQLANSGILLDRLLNIAHIADNTVQELQEILGVSRPTIYNLLKKKEFRWIQLDGGKYRISKKSFDDWLDNLEQ